MIVREAKSGEEARWDEYVQGCTYSTPQHLFAWKKVMEEVFKSKTFYLLAEENGSISGVLPLIHIKSLLGGNYITSHPGGICTDSDEAAGLLFAYAKELVEAQNAKYLILRDGRRKWDLPDIVTDTEHVTFLINIQDKPEQLVSSMRRRTRRVAAVSMNNGSSAKVGFENFSNYYPIYLRAMRELGTPTLGFDFFENIACAQGMDINLITLIYGNRIVGGGFIYPFRKTVYCLWSGLLHEYYQHHTSFLLSWESIKFAHKNGDEWVDMGRCRKGSGGYEFKLGFGGQEQQLYQQVYLNGLSHAPSVGAQRKADIKYQAFTKVWRALPLPVTELLGPILRKQMPFG